MGIQESFNKLKFYCEKENFSGWDPYDGLNSRIFQSFIPKNKVSRLLWIQLFKRNPVNLRRIFCTTKSANPKALGLFLSSYCLIAVGDSSISNKQNARSIIVKLSQLISQKKSEGWSGDCWGYNFDWQARAFFQPKYTPTVVASTFIANALLDAYEVTRDEKLLQSARSTCDFILNDLNRTYDDIGNFCFSYSPLDKSAVYNASLLGSKLLARVYSYTGEKELIEAAKRSVIYCCDKQNNDGSWSYGSYSFHQWIDNFHTGYNLECIGEYMKYSGDYRFEKYLEKGFEYYIKTFFTDEGIPRYYNNSTYPIDIHAPAQLVITLSKLSKFQSHKSLVEKVIQWTIMNMQSPKGYFYYQKNKLFSSKIPYMRWAQAWMFYALTTYLFENGKEQN